MVGSFEAIDEEEKKVTLYRCKCGFALFIPIGKVKFERGPVLVQEFTPMCFKCAACGKILQFDQGKIIKQMEEEN